MKKRIIWGVAIALLLGVLLWRFIPRSGQTLMPVAQSDITSFSAISMVGGIEDAEPYFDIYRIDSADATTEDIERILEILKASGYRPAFRNILSWAIRSVDAGRNYDNRTVTAQFACGDDYLIVSVYSPTKVGISTKDDSCMRVYHPTNKEVLTRLVEYLETNGTLQQEE